jgi:anti-anti-sigma factor
MLRISVDNGEASTAIELEGKLSGPEVNELAACWLAVLSADSGKSIVVDLKQVDFIDGAGKELLAEMHRRGAKLLAAGVETRAIVERIEGRKR